MAWLVPASRSAGQDSKAHRVSRICAALVLDRIMVGVSLSPNGHAGAAAAANDREIVPTEIHFWCYAGTRRISASRSRVAPRNARRCARARCAPARPRPCGARRAASRARVTMRSPSARSSRLSSTKPDTPSSAASREPSSSPTRMGLAHAAASSGRQRDAFARAVSGGGDQREGVARAVEQRGDPARAPSP